MNRRTMKMESLESRELLTTIFVTSDADAGTGTFREAIETANLDADVDRIAFAPSINTVELASSVEYTGGQNLAINGRGATLTTAAADANAFDLLVSSGDANMNIRNIKLVGGSKGFFAPISPDASGTIKFSFTRVAVEDNGLFGLHIDDQTDGSDASLDVNIRNSRITGNGTGALDFDGVRVDEGGMGSIHARVLNSIVDENGGDGLELDERGDGGVKMFTKGSSYNGNGFFNEEDLDDGLDIDEADDGNLWFKAVRSTFSDNFDEGLDLDEEQGGNVYLSLHHIVANNNVDEGIKVDEKFDDDGINSDGNFVANLFKVTANGNQSEEGIALSEEGAGSFTVNLAFVDANNNGKEGIDLAETGDGNIRVKMLKIKANDNGDDGIQIEEEGEGNLVSFATFIRANGNAKFGLNLEQEAVAASDFGVMFLLLENLTGNTDGELNATNVTVF